MAPRSIRSVATAGAVTALVLLTGACKVDVDVAIDADGTGGGEVEVTARLDEQAVANLGGPTPEKRLALGDLADAGWEVEGPTPTEAGGLEIVARHPFEDGADAERVLAQVAGEQGPLRDVALSQERTFLRTSSTFAATVDLTGGLGAFTDAELRQALAGPEGAPLGVNDQQLAARFGAPVVDMFDLDVRLELPGEPVSNAPATAGGTPEWSPRLGERVVLEARSERWNVRNIASATIAGAAGLAAVAVLLRRRLATAHAGRTVPFDQDEASP